MVFSVPSEYILLRLPGWKLLLPRLMNKITLQKDEKPSLKRDHPVAGLLFILLGALVVRILYLILIVGPDAFPLNIDSIEHHMIATSLVEGRGYTLYGQPSAYRAPFLTYFMALHYLLFGQSFLMVRLGMILLSLCLIGGVYLLGAEIFSPRAGLWAAGMAAIYPHLIFYNARIFTETPFTLFSLLAIWFFIRLMRSPSRKNLAGTVVFLSLAILTRPAGIALLIIMVAFILFKQINRLNIKIALFILVFTMVLMSPWIVRNYVVFHRIIPVTTQGGVVLWVSNNHYVAYHPYYYGMHRLYQYLPGAARLIPDDEIARSSYATQYTGQFIRSYPGDIPRLLWNKMRRFWEKDFSTGSARRWMYEYSYLMILLLAAGGVIMAIRAGNRKTVYLWLILLASFLPALIFWAGARIRLPAEPVLILFAAYLLSEIYRRTAEKWKV